MAPLPLFFIGSGNAFAPGGLCWNGFVAGERHLFEAPPQTLMALNRARIDPNAIETVVISHHHGDHCLGLPFLLLHWKYRGRTAPVDIVGPPGTRELAEDVGLRVFPGLFESAVEIRWHELRPGEELNLNGMHLRALPMKHDERLAYNLGYQATIAGRRLAYTGDTAWCDSVEEMARWAEILVAECASRDERIPIHMNLVDDMPRLRAAMSAESLLVLTHLDASIRSTELPRTFVARDFGQLVL
ncbi:Ribonuclease BN [bacterium HR29]|jgi:ribonuclease BN (tRNA processing enzyme)|nr:Ribonuclease BN [bacterium HR29]